MAKAGLYRIRNKSKSSVVKLFDSVTVTFLKQGLFKPNIQCLRKGSAYGGWYVPSLVNSSASGKVLISAGLGKDITFDVAMMELGFKVVGIDPIKESIAYVNKIVSNNANYTLIEACLAKDNLGLFMYAPSNEGHISWSVISGRDFSGKFYPSITLDDIEENATVGQSQLKILKMDIEGAELDVLDQISRKNDVYAVCLAELDYISKQPYKNFPKRLLAIIRTRKVLKSLHRQGYVIIATEGYNFSWLHESEMESQLNFERRDRK